MARRSSVDWTFLTPHGQVLLCIAGDPGVRLEEIGERVGIGDAEARTAVAELTDAGYITRDDGAREARYTVNADLPLPDPIARERNVGVLVELLVAPRRARGDADRRE